MMLMSCSKVTVFDFPLRNNSLASCGFAIFTKKIRGIVKNSSQRYLQQQRECAIVLYSFHTNPQNQPPEARKTSRADFLETLLRASEKSSGRWSDGLGPFAGRVPSWVRESGVSVVSRGRV